MSKDHDNDEVNVFTISREEWAEIERWGQCKICPRDRDLIGRVLRRHIRLDARAHAGVQKSVRVPMSQARDKLENIKRTADNLLKHMTPSEGANEYLSGGPVDNGIHVWGAGQEENKDAAILLTHWHLDQIWRRHPSHYWDSREIGELLRAISEAARRGIDEARDGKRASQRNRLREGTIAALANAYRHSGGQLRIRKDEDGRHSPFAAFLAKINDLMPERHRLAETSEGLAVAAEKLLRWARNNGEKF